MTSKGRSKFFDIHDIFVPSVVDLRLAAVVEIIPSPASGCTDQFVACEILYPKPAGLCGMEIRFPAHLRRRKMFDVYGELAEDVMRAFRADCLAAIREMDAKEDKDEVRAMRAEAANAANAICVMQQRRSER